MDMLYIFDYAHGANVSGKCSPRLPQDFLEAYKDSPVIKDGRFREYLFSRHIINNVRDLLDKDTTFPYITELSVHGEDEIGLRARVENINTLYKNYKHRPTLVISQHNNAAGSQDKWEKARGFCIYTTRGQTGSDDYAEHFYTKFESKFPDIKIRRELIDGDSDYESNFAVLMCKPYAMLIELGFQDNLDDIRILLNPEFQQQYIAMMVEFCKEQAK